MREEIHQKSESNLIELENTELETVAGGTVGLTRTAYNALCGTCHWEATFGTSTEADNAVTEHRQKNPGHIVSVTAIRSI